MLWAPGEENIIRLAHCRRGSRVIVPRQRARVDAGPGRLCAAVSVSPHGPSGLCSDPVIGSGLRRRRGEYGQDQAESQAPEKPKSSSMVSHGLPASSRSCAAHRTSRSGRCFHQTDISWLFQGPPHGALAHDPCEASKPRPMPTRACQLLGRAMARLLTAALARTAQGGATPGAGSWEFTFQEVAHTPGYRNASEGGALEPATPRSSGRRHDARGEARGTRMKQPSPNPFVLVQVTRFRRGGPALAPRTSQR
jgi:hypothetical protein